MARILLADDDSNLRGTLEEVLIEAGHEVICASNGELATSSFDEAIAAGNNVDVAIVDLLLPKIAGLDLANLLKARAPETKIIFITGVFKTTAHKQDAEQKHSPLAYLTKPFDNATLVSLIEKTVGAGRPKPKQAAVPTAAMPDEGNLLEAPVVHLLWRAAREQQTGILDVFGTEGKRGRAFIFKGRLTLAQCADSAINVGIELVRHGSLTADMYVQACALALERGRGLHAVIKEEGWADDNAFKDAYRVASPKAVAFFIGASGKFRWTDGDDFAKVVPSAPIDLLPVLKAALRLCPAKDLMPHVDPRGPLRLAPGPNWDEIVAILDDATGSTSLTRAINGRATIAQMLAASRNDDDRNQRYRQAHLLMSTQAVAASMEVIPMAAVEAVAAPAPPTPRPSMPQPSMPQPSPPSTPQPSPGAARAARPTPAPQPSADAGLTFSREEQLARRKIEEKYAAIKDLGPFAVLQVPSDASVADVKKAYFALAREWHTDSFAGLQLGDGALTLDLLFGKIQDAHATLTDPSKRAELDAGRQMEEDGMSTDIAALFEAENDVHKGRHLLERGEMFAASKLFERACGVNPANKEWRAHHIYSRWWGKKNPADGEKVMVELEAIGKELAAVLDITYFAGHVALEIGNLKKAKSLLRRVTAEDAGHAMANRALRTLQKRLEDDEKKAKGGGIGGFFKR